METIAYSKMVSPSSILDTDHDRIAALCDELLEAYGTDDWAVVRSAWGRFERALTAHIQAEETWLLPFYAIAEPAEAQALRRDHDVLRRRLDEIGFGIDLHCANDEVGREMVALLRDHARREDSTLYPWADQHLDPLVAAALRARLEQRTLEALSSAARARA